MTQFPVWLLTWSMQIALLVAAGALASAMLSSARAWLIFWQALLLVVLVLPLVEPWQMEPMVVVKTAPVTPSLMPGAVVAAQSGFHWTSQDWLLAIAAGAVLRLLWVAIGLLRLRHYRQRATLLAEPPFPFANASVRWYRSTAVPGPVTYGWLRPSVLLPEWVMQLPSAMREAVACHELVHVRRRDWLFVMAEECVRAALWFHPAVWYALSRIQLAREYAVDSEAVQLTDDRDGYLEALVEVAAQGLRPDLAPAPLFLRKRQLALRVAAVLKETGMTRSRIAARFTAARLTAVGSAMFAAARAAIWLVPFVSPAQTVMDDPGVTVDAGATLLHRASVHHPAGATGTLTLEATLDSKGEVTDAHVLSGPEDLRKDALSSVLQWHYAPGVSRVQISLRFDAVAPAQGVGTGIGAGVGAGVGTGVGTGIGGGRGGGRVAATGKQDNPVTVKSIEFAGFTPEAEQGLRRLIPVHEGDTVTSADSARISDAVREFDSHAAVMFLRKALPGGGNETTLLVRVLPQGVAQIQAAAEPAPEGIPGVQKIASGVASGNLIRNVPPVYPALAKQARIQGVVKFQIVIATDGTIRQLTLISGNPLLVQAARDAISQWVYKPTLLNNAPVEVQTQADVNFVLQN